MATYDCFMYNGEEKMLYFRMHELKDVVDYFVFTESEYTHKGDKKALRFPEQRARFAKFADKIIYLPNFTPPAINDAWRNEGDQRNYLIEGLKDKQLFAQDLILIGDVDEIPDVQVMTQLRGNNFAGIGTFYQNFHYYNFNTRNLNKWCGTVVFNVGSGYLNMGLEQNRRNRFHLPRIGQDGNYDSGGWHLSYFGDSTYIIEKIKSFAHQEYSTTNEITIQAFFCSNFPISRS